MKHDLRVTVTKRMIREALLQLLETTPLDKIKVNELCRTAGINRATFYRHYETLQDVLHEIETEFIRQMPCPGKAPHSVDEARSHMEAICTYLYNHSHMVRLLLQNQTGDDLMQGMNALYRSFLELRKKEPYDLDEDTAKAIIALVGGGSHCLLRQWILGDIRKTPAEIAAILCNVIRWPDPKDFT